MFIDIKVIVIENLNENFILGVEAIKLLEINPLDFLIKKSDECILTSINSSEQNKFNGNSKPNNVTTEQKNLMDIGEKTNSEYELKKNT
ncbi:hypothetical protein GVAV_000203 [Gurleya vavrai]